MGKLGATLVVSWCVCVVSVRAFWHARPASNGLPVHSKQIGQTHLPIFTNPTMFTPYFLIIRSVAASNQPAAPSAQNDAPAASRIIFELMSSEDAVLDVSGSEQSTSEESHFSHAGPVSLPKQPERSKKKGKKRAENSSIHDDFDDREFVFKDRECDMGRSDDGGTLGAGLEKSLNEMPSPNGGEEPMKKKKKETRKQVGGGNVRRSAGRGGGQSRSTSAGRTQRQGGGGFRPDAFLEQAAERQRTDGISTGHSTSKAFSLTGSPTAQTSNERAATNKMVGKGKDRGHKAPPGQGWTSSRNTDQVLKLGMVGKGKGKTPSTTTRRSKDKRALDLSKSNAGRGQREAGLIDMTSDYNDDGKVKGALSRKRTSSPVSRDAGSDDGSYGVADVFSSGSGGKSSNKRSGVDWELNSNNSDHGGFSSSDSGEDFAEESRKDEQSNGKREKKARTSNKNGSSKPIDITEDDEETSATQGSVFSTLGWAAKKIFQGSGSGSKRGKDEQGGSGMCTVYLYLPVFWSLVRNCILEFSFSPF